MFITVQPHFYSFFQPRFLGIREAHPLWALNQVMKVRMSIDQPAHASRILTTQRDGFRKNLKAARIIKDISVADGVFVSCISQLFSLISDHVQYQGLARKSIPTSLA
jgi:hypothetical protein